MIGKIITQPVIKGPEKRCKPKSIQTGNREWATLIAAINATGWTIPPIRILTG
jgi:hypothetical protein